MDWGSDLQAAWMVPSCGGRGSQCKMLTSCCCCCHGLVGKTAKMLNFLWCCCRDLGHERHHVEVLVVLLLWGAGKPNMFRSLRSYCCRGLVGQDNEDPGRHVFPTFVHSLRMKKWKGINLRLGMILSLRFIPFHFWVEPFVFVFGLGFGFDVLLQPDPTSPGRVKGASGVSGQCTPSP